MRTWFQFISYRTKCLLDDSFKTPVNLSKQDLSIVHVDATCWGGAIVTRLRVVIGSLLVSITT